MEKYNIFDVVAGTSIGAINSIDDNKKNMLTSRFNDLLIEPAKSKQRDGKTRRYQDLIKGRFDLDTAFHLERKDDPDTISNKWIDLSKTTNNFR